MRREPEANNEHVHRKSELSKEGTFRKMAIRKEEDAGE